MAFKRDLGSFRLLLCDSLSFFSPLFQAVINFIALIRVCSVADRSFHLGITVADLPSSFLSIVLLLLGPWSRRVLLSLCPPALLYRQQQIVEVRFQVFTFCMVTLGGLPHFLRFFFRSCLLNFFCGQRLQPPLPLPKLSSLGRLWISWMCFFHQSVTHPLTSISRGTHPSCHLAAKGGGAKVPEPRPNHVPAALLKAPQLPVLIVLVSPFMTVSSS